MITRLPIALVLLAASGAAAKPTVPKDAPYCAEPETHPLFLSPMGEPFRAEHGRPYPSAAWFTEADRNRDGAVDRAEFIGDADRFFRLLDLDHDGRLVPEDIIAYERDVAPEIALYGARGRDFQPAPPRAPKAGESDYGGAMGAGRYAWLNIPEPVSSADADVDRAVTEREFAQAAGRRFDALDTAGHGRLTLAALPPTPLQVAIEGPCRPRPKSRRDDEGRDARPRGPGR